MAPPKANELVIAAGAWLPKLTPELNLPLTVERNVLFWYEPVASPEVFEPDRLPVWILEIDDEHAFYGFPNVPGQGVKVARHHGDPSGTGEGGPGYKYKDELPTNLPPAPTDPGSPSPTWAARCPTGCRKQYGRLTPTPCWSPPTGGRT